MTTQTIQNKGAARCTSISPIFTRLHPCSFSRHRNPPRFHPQKPKGAAGCTFIKQNAHAPNCAARCTTHTYDALARSFVLGLKVEGQSTQTDSSGPIDYSLTDGHGSTRALIDLSGSVAQSYDYDAFGTALDFNPNTALTPWLFAGDGLYDPATGWTYQLARWRDGFRFTSMDTFQGDRQSPLSFHKYAYASNDPVINIDDSGHFFTLMDSLVSGAIDHWDSASDSASASRVASFARSLNQAYQTFNKARKVWDTISSFVEL
jgi:RHS repeat-associated protein